MLLNEHAPIEAREVKVESMIYALRSM